MARIVLSTVGVRGDLNPFLSLGLGLRARGHDVLFAVEEMFCQAIMEEGFAFHRLPSDVKETLLPHFHQLVGGFTPLASWQIIQDVLGRYTLADLQSTVQDEWDSKISTLTRGWVIWHVMQHDLLHGGEIAYSLGMHGLPAPSDTNLYGG